LTRRTSKIDLTPIQNDLVQDGKEHTVMKFARNKEREVNRRYRTSIKRLLVLPIALLALPAVLSCRNESAPPQDGPVLERSSIHYMLPTVNAAYTEVVAAEEMLSSNPPNVVAARNSLGKARQSLAILEDFYVPATDARENIYNAYLEHLAGHPAERDTFLDLARRGLLQIVDRSNHEVEPYIMDLADRIESVQFHVRDGVPIGDELKSLCEIFQLHLLKAQLVINEHSFDEQKTGD
jgi:hypothetical protein